MYIYHNFLIHSSANGHLDCFHVLAAVNSATINMRLLQFWFPQCVWKFLKEMGITDHLSCLLRNLNAGQEATVKTRHGTTHWFQIGKGVRQGCILSPCLYMQMTTHFLAESEEELKSLLMKEKEQSENVGLKLNIQKTKIMASGPITSWQTGKQWKQ